MHCKKTSFSDEAQALFYIDKLQRTSVRPKKPQSAYLCPRCNNWHITSIVQFDEVSEKEIKRLNQEIEKLKIQLKQRDRKIQSILNPNLNH